LYVGIDLHSNNMMLATMDEKGTRRTHVKLENSLEVVLSALEPSKDLIEGIVVESTYNWYWLVDGLRAAGYPVRLAHATGLEPYKGRKHLSDRHDAYFLADLLRLNILPEGYIYPPEQRPLRDLMRTRIYLVGERTKHILRLGGMLANNVGVRLRGNAIRGTRKDQVRPLVEAKGNLAHNVDVMKSMVDLYTEKIHVVERLLLAQLRDRLEHKLLMQMNGLGTVLAHGIVLESGPMERFSQVGDYVSYCRKVPTAWESNQKLKGRGNKRNGNRYLAWLYSELSEMARQHEPRAKAYFERKRARTNRMVAHAALAHKYARACYYILRDKVPFEVDRLFS
jgi:transposase